MAYAAAVPGDWWGNVTINTNASTDGAVVTAHINGSDTVTATDIVGTPDSGYYLIHAEASSGDTVIFKVFGVNASPTNITPASWSAGSHEMNLTITTLSNGEVCSYNGACTTNNCASDYDGAGSWCAASGACMHDNASTANAGTVCSSTTVKQTCTSGSWVATTCTYGCSGGACGSAPSGGTTGGGGGGGVTEVSESISLGTASAGQTVTATYTKSNDIKIQEISVNLKNSVTNAYIQVKESSLPSGANLAIETTAGATYKYLQVITTHMTNDDIDKATVKFKVAKSWINSNNIDKSTIAMNRYDSDSSSWTKYAAAISSEDSSYVYYTVELPGLSVLAITGEKAVAGAVCTAGAKTCVGNDLQQCKSDGSAWETLETCAYGCDSATKACKLAPEAICTPGEKKCADNDLQQCKSDGSAWETLETCAYGCDSATKACKPAPAQVCTAGEKKCVGNELQKCRSDGSAWDRLETCEHGCDPAAKLCKLAPLVIPVEYIIAGIIAIVVIIAALVLYLRK